MLDSLREPTQETYLTFLRKKPVYSVKRRMSRFIVFLLVLSIESFSPLCFAGTIVSLRKEIPKTYFVSIGIGQYNVKGLKILTTPLNDATLLHNTVTQELGYESTLLVDREATRQEILAILEKIKKKKGGKPDFKSCSKIVITK